MSKPKYIHASYSQKMEFDLDEIGVDWDKVKDFSIKHKVLTIYYKDGKQENFNGDYSFYEDVISVFDKDWDEVTNHENR